MSQDQTPQVEETKKAAAAAVEDAKQRATAAATQAEQSMTSKAGTAQNAVADGLRTAGDKLGSLGENEGVVGDLAEKASEGLAHASEWVAKRDPDAMLTDVKTFAKRKPWVAAGIAVGALMVLNRITRALTGGSKKR